MVPVLPAAGRPMSTQNAIVVDGEFLLWDARAGSRVRVGTVNDLRGVRFFRFDGSAAVVTTAKPNVVLILADDLGWTDLACYGSDLHETPHLDRLARDGMKFTQNYSACTVCSPTRARKPP